MHQPTLTNVHIKQISISNIALKVGKDSDNHYGEISTIDKSLED